MEQITYQEQVFWGTSLNMANEIEINQCYKYIKEQVERTGIFFTKCKQAEAVKKRWLCGESVKNYSLCGKQKGILKEHLLEIIGTMVTDNLAIDGDKILEVFQARGYIDIYPCDRVYLLRDI